MSNRLVTERQLYTSLFDITNQRWQFLSLQLEAIMSLNPSQTSFAIVTDLDGTLASDDPATAKHSNTSSIVFPNAKQFLQTCVHLRVRVFLITSRTNRNDIYTLFKQNQMDKGDVDRLFSHIFVRPSEDDDVALSKRLQRNLIRAQGHSIIMTIGDRPHDLAFGDFQGAQRSSLIDDTINVLIDNPFE